MPVRTNFIVFFLIVWTFPTAVFSSPVAASWQSDFILPQYSKTVSVDFKNADLKDIMKIISRQIGVNFVFDSNVEVKPVTVFMENVPIEEALEMILSANDLVYDFSQQTNIIRVKMKPDTDLDKETRIYPLHYATVATSSMGSTLSSASSSSSSVSSSSGSSSSGSSGSSKSSGATAGASSSGGAFLGEIKNAVQLILPKGVVIEDSRTNSLVITAPVRAFPAIERLIAEMDVPVPQIIIDVEMLDVGKNDVDLLGVKFSGNAADVTAFGQIPNAGNTGYSAYKDVFRFFEEGKVTSSLAAAIQFLRTRTDSKSLARPRVMTLNNQKAVIQLSMDEVIGETVTVDSAGVSTITAERATTGVVLTVTPQADIMTGEIILALSPKVIEARPGPSYSRAYKNPEERSVEAYLKVQNGHTIVIAGLLRSEMTKITTKVPLLGDIPVLGMAFRHKNLEAKDRELIIILTPRIVGVGELPQAVNSPTISTYFNDVQKDNVAAKFVISGEQDRSLVNKN